MKSLAINVVLTFVFNVISTSGSANSIFDNLPDVDQNFQPPANMPDYNDIIQKRLDRCTVDKGYDVKEAIQDEVNNALSCLSGHFNQKELDSEIEKAKNTGTLDEIFKKYCAKQTDMKTCIRPVIDHGRVCLTEKENATVETAWGALDAALEFVCYKGGDRIALFLGEEGQECIRSRTDFLPNCFENLNLNQTESEMFVLDEVNCRTIHDVRTCVVKELKKCKNSTPSNIIESLLNAMLKTTPCGEESVVKNRASASTDLGAESVAETGSNSASSQILDAFLTLAPVLITLLFRR